MKKIVYFFTFIITFFAFLVLTSCSSSKVAINSLDLTDSKDETKTLTSNHIGYNAIKNTNSIIKDEHQYTVINKSNLDVILTVSLDNPEAYSINALKLKCDDLNAIIYIDGKQQKLDVNGDGSRVVLWNSEDAYQKQYHIILASQELKTTISILGVRIEGHDSFISYENNKNGKNNVLDIYKLSNDDIGVKTIYNSPSEYCFKMICNENYIENLVVSAGDSIINSDNDGLYKTAADSISCTYSIIDKDTKSNVEWKLSREIEKLAIKGLCYPIVYSSEYLATGLYVKGTEPQSNQYYISINEHEMKIDKNNYREYSNSHYHELTFSVYDVPELTFVKGETYTVKFYMYINNERIDLYTVDVHQSDSSGQDSKQVWLTT